MGGEKLELVNGNHSSDWPVKGGAAHRLSHLPGLDAASPRANSTEETRNLLTAGNDCRRHC